VSLYKIAFTPTSSKTIAKYKKSNPQNYKKLVKVLEELMKHPRTGTGHPEPLRQGRSVTYSRRLTAHDRIIYDIYDNTVTVLVLALEEHYKDK